MEIRPIKEKGKEKRSCKWYFLEKENNGLLKSIYPLILFEEKKY